MARALDKFMSLLVAGNKENLYSYLMKTAHLNALRALEAALRLGGFREAAHELSVTPAAVGQQIRTLENYLGISLFERHPKGARPTTSAINASIRLTASFRELSQLLDEFNPVSDDTVSVTMTHAIAESWLPKELPDFFRSIGSVDFRMDTSRSIVDLRQGEFNFAIRHSDKPESNLEALTLFPSYIVPVCTPDFADRYKIKPNTRSIANVPLGHVPVETTDPLWQEWADWCKHYDVEGPRREEAQTISAGAGNLTMASAGIALVLAALVDSFEAIQEGKLIAPFGTEKVVRTKYSYRLVWQNDRRLSKPQIHFRDWIDKRARMHRDAIENWLKNT